MVSFTKMTLSQILTWSIRFYIIWFLTPSKLIFHWSGFAHFLSAMTVFFLLFWHTELIPPWKTWHLLLSLPGLILSQILTPKWIQIHSDAVSLERPSLTSVKRNPVTLYYMKLFLFSSEHFLLSETSLLFMFVLSPKVWDKNVFWLQYLEQGLVHGNSSVNI